MPIIRNPFRKQDENARPQTTLNGVEKTNGASKSVEPINIKEPAEYKLSGAFCASNTGFRVMLTMAQKSMTAASTFLHLLQNARASGIPNRPTRLRRAITGVC